ncbi:hypothetical protein LOK49_LG01G04151 [Camellia lanceoleosa]|uniref:Uncharacterized protein n=1 Tax=Camellia lanceoleosa TaxID=1840588 RepID=A0ACC0IV00_9ERIC|nr:hypothetical protein LOK49_LG01G04151 [Camellia lanceoleosa]
MQLISALRLTNFPYPDCSIALMRLISALRLTNSPYPDCSIALPLTLTPLLSRHWSVPLSSLRHRRASLRHRRSSLRHHRAFHLCLELPSSRGEDLQSKCLLELYGLEGHIDGYELHQIIEKQYYDE